MSLHQTNYDMTIEIEGHDNMTFIFTSSLNDGSLGANIQLQFIAFNVNCWHIFLFYFTSFFWNR